MDTEKRPDEPAQQAKPEQPKSMGHIVGDLVVSGAAMPANTAATVVVNRAKRAARKSKPVRAGANSAKKKRSVAASKVVKSKKAKRASKKTGPKNAGKMAGRTSAKKSKKK
jgi:hypothetical protein